MKLDPFIEAEEAAGCSQLLFGNRYERPLAHVLPRVEGGDVERPVGIRCERDAKVIERMQSHLDT